MKLAILGNSPNSYFDEIVQAAAGTHEVGFVSWDELVAEVGNSETISAETRSGHDFDAVLVRGMPLGSLEQVIFKMNVLARWNATGVPVFNPPRALEIAIDKYLSLSLIRNAGLNVPDSIVCQTVDASMEAFDRLGGDVVVKPVFGGEGRGMIRVTDPEIALRSFRAIVNTQCVVFQQRFVDCGNRDMRLLLIGDQVLGMVRHNPTDWRANASRGATCERFEPTDEQVAIARRAASAVGTGFAGVDLVEDRAGEVLVLEVNGIPGWKAIQQVHQVNVAELLWDWLQGEAQVAEQRMVEHHKV